MKALIFAGNSTIYLNYINTYHLKRTECKYVYTIPDIQGYHKDTNPDLLLIFLADFWLTPAGNENSEMIILMEEFAGQVYFQGTRTVKDTAEAAARIIQLSYITSLEQLPEYLSHENEKVRDAAIKRQEELNSKNGNDIYDLP